MHGLQNQGQGLELGGFSEEAKRRYRDEHWEEDLQRAFEAGKRMAEELKVEN